MAVPFDGSRDEPVIGKATALFKNDYDFGQGVTIANYDVTADGRFVMLRRDAQSGQLHVVLNWTEELRQILAKSGRGSGGPFSARRRRSGPACARRGP